jgi:hypothetical protein
MRASARRGAEHARVAHRTVYRTCLVHHRIARRAHKSELQRSEPNGLHQTASLVVGVINTPNHPTFKSSKFSTFQLLTRALAFNSRHTQVIKSSPNSTKALVLSERDLLVFLRALALGLLSSFSFFLVIKTQL